MAVADTTGSRVPPDAETAQHPIVTPTGRAWWHRHMEPEERRRIMNDLAMLKVDHWVYRFGTMLTLSIVVAVMGLSLDSAAVVIGAMLLAPLMQPVLATGGSLSMALFTKSLISLTKVAGATAWCIGIAYAISWLLPEQELTGEVLSRTQPDIKDLVVALAAGLAGAYATVRADVSSSLPGVAVAVALVPPLGSVGITLEHGERTLALGALLLYITNLLAIIAASIAVFVFTGFVHPRRLSENLLRVSLATVSLVAVVVLAAVPLYRTTVSTIERQDDQRAARAIVAEWLGDLDDDLDPQVTVNRAARQVVVELRGFQQPPDQEALVEAMRLEFPEFDVPVQWIRVEAATTTTLPAPEPTEQLLAEIDAAVREWLTSAGIDHRVEGLSLDENRVRVEVASTDDPPPIEGLIERLQAIDPSLEPDLAWSELRTITGQTAPTPEQLRTQAMREVVDAWAAERDLEVTAFEHDGERVMIAVTGAEEPDFGRLEIELRTLAEARVPVDVYFTRRALVTTTAIPSFPVDAG